MSTDQVRFQKYKGRFLLMLVIYFASTACLWAQQFPLVSLRFKSAPLESVLEYLKEEYQVQVAYENKKVEGYKITVELEKVTLEDALEAVLRSTELSFKIIRSGKVVIFPRSVQHSELSVVDTEVFQSNSKKLLAGLVIDDETGETIPYAVIRLARTSYGTSANQDGYFALSFDHAGVDSVTVYHLGYHSATIAVSGHNDLNIRLKPSFSILAGVEVNDQLQTKLEIPGKPSQAVINPAEVDNIPQVGVADIFRSIQMLPGISIADETSAGLNIRGGLPDQNLILFDGFTIYHLEHLHGFFSSLNPAAIKDVRIYKGGYGAKYGGRISSVIDITGFTGNRNQPSGNLGLNLLSADLNLEAPVGKHSSAFFSIRRAYNDLVSSRLSEKLSDYASETLPGLNEGTGLNLRIPGANSFSYYDMNGKFTSWLGKKNKIALSFYRGFDRYREGDRWEIDTRLRFFSEDLKENYQLSNDGISFKWDRIWNPSLYGTLSAGYSTFNKSYNLELNAQLTTNDGDTSRLITVDRDNYLNELSLKYDLEQTINSRHFFEYGIFINHNEIGYQDQTNLSPVVRNIDDKGSQSGIYWQDNFTPWEPFSLRYGFRLTNHSLDRQWYFEPRLNFDFEISEGFFLKGATGRYYQFISQAETNLPFNFNQDFWLLNDGSFIPITSANHYIAGLSYTFRKWIFDLEFYYQQKEGLMQADYRLNQNTDNLRQQWQFNRLLTDGDGFSRGLDLMVNTSLGKFNSSLAYSLNSVKQQFEEINAGESFYADNHQHHELKWLNFYQAGSWHFSFNWMYGSGRPVTSPSGVERNDDRFFLIYDEKNNDRLPAYNRADFAISRLFKFGGSKLDAGFSIFNVFDAENVGNTNFYLDRFELFKRNPKIRLPRLASSDQLLLDRTFSVFMNFKF